MDMNPVGTKPGGVAKSGAGVDASGENGTNGPTGAGGHEKTEGVHCADDFCSRASRRSCLTESDRLTSSPCSSWTFTCNHSCSVVT
jgi:hypothetical protein